MRTLLVIMSSLALAYGQDFWCTNRLCKDTGAFASRPSCISCRMYCDMDLNGDNWLTSEEMESTFRNDWQCGDACDLSAFQAVVTSRYQFCDREVAVAFRDFALESNTSDPNLITAADVVAWHNDIAVSTESGLGIDFTSYLAWWDSWYNYNTPSTYTCTAGTCPVSP